LAIWWQNFEIGKLGNLFWLDRRTDFSHGVAKAISQFPNSKISKFRWSSLGEGPKNHGFQKHHSAIYDAAVAIIHSNLQAPQQNLTG
jgi:hypothetical protein